MDPKIKESIDAMTYEEMLRRHRYAVSNDPMFQGETGKYFQKVLWQKASALRDNVRTEISAKVGWK